MDNLGDLKTPLPEVFVVKPEKSAKSLFVMIPLLAISLVALGIFIIWSFGWVSFENYDKKQLSVMIGDPRPEVRRMAATDWASRLVNQAAESTVLTPGPEETRSLLLSFESLRVSYEMDVKWGSSLIAILSYSTESELVSAAFVDYLLQNSKDAKSEFLFYTLMGLARLKVPDNSKIQEDLSEALKSLSQSQDVSVRKAVALVSGTLHGTSLFEERILGILMELLADPDQDTRANAALALLKAGRREGTEVLNSLMNEIDQLDSNKVPLNQLDRALLILAALAQSPAEEHQLRIKDWADKHPNFKIRNAAKKSIPITRP